MPFGMPVEKDNNKPVYKNKKTSDVKIDTDIDLSLSKNKKIHYDQKDKDKELLITPSFQHKKNNKNNVLLNEKEKNELNGILNYIKKKKNTIQCEDSIIYIVNPYPSLMILSCSLLYFLATLLLIYYIDLFQKSIIYLCLFDYWIFLIQVIAILLYFIGAKGVRPLLNTYSKLLITFCLIGVGLILFLRLGIISKSISIFIGSFSLAVFTASLPFPVRFLGATRFMFIGGPKFHWRLGYPIAYITILGFCFLSIIFYYHYNIQNQTTQIFINKEYYIENLKNDAIDVIELKQNLNNVEKWIKSFYPLEVKNLQKLIIYYIINLLKKSPTIYQISDTQLCTFDHSKSNPELWNRIVEKRKYIELLVNTFEPILKDLEQSNKKIVNDQIDLWLDSPFSYVKAFFISDLLAVHKILNENMKKPTAIVSQLAQNKIKISGVNKKVCIFDSVFFKNISNIIEYDPKQLLIGKDFDQTTKWKSFILFDQYPSYRPPPHSLVIIRKIIGIDNTKSLNARKKNKISNSEIWLIFSSSDLEEAFIETMKYSTIIRSSKSFPDQSMETCGNNKINDFFTLKDGSNIAIRRCVLKKKQKRVVVISLLN